jgi:3-oxo-5alpha-steroid 4-dehydrogenase
MILPEEVLSDSLARIQPISCKNKDASCEFGKALQMMLKNSNGPFYIMDISIDSKLAPLTTLTLGGLIVNEETGEVLDQQSETRLKGCMLPGERQLVVCSNIYVSGLSIADCIFSGRRIGQHVSVLRNKL